MTETLNRLEGPTPAGNSGRAQIFSVTSLADVERARTNSWRLTKIEPVLVVRHRSRGASWSERLRGGDDVDGAVGFEDDLVEIPIVGFTSLSECFSERVGIEPCALEVAGEDVAVVDE